MREIKHFEPSGLEVAIIGMAARLPGARTVDQYWRNLLDGKETIHRFTDEELAELAPDMMHLPNYVKAFPRLDDVDQFDAAFFGSSPREAELMDPQQRVFLECCWEAIEDAGYDVSKYPGLIGIFAGQKMSTYFFNIYSQPEIAASAGELVLMAANDKDYIATRVAYRLDLGGPAVSVQTACSTSLVATHLAAQALLSGECDMALAGGVAIRLPQAGYIYHPGEVYSPDGHCRAFDIKAAGTVFGNGGGAVLLKRLDDALEDGDHIHAVIRGSAVSNDGSRKVGFTAPGADGQERVVRAAQLAAEVEPETITYVEAHGTGTEIGDPIEVGALSRVFREQTDRVGYCALGSVKTNIGHLNAAAGMASLIKATLAVEQGRIPGTLHFETPNPQLELDKSPFFIHTETIDWQPEDMPRRAGVSSFGIGGTNAHLILEQAPPREEGARPSRPRQLVLLSARGENALGETTERLVAHLDAHLEAHTEEDPTGDADHFADIAHTLRIGRKGFEQRRALVAESAADAAATLGEVGSPRVLSRYCPESGRPAAFLFSGQGSQYVHMAAETWEHEPVFREHFDECREILRPILGLDLRDVVHPATADDAEAAEKLQQTSLTQPALFAVEYSLARMWMSWGVEPRAMLGHSIGEYVSACLGGTLSLGDALALVAERGRLMQSLPPGSMLTVPLTEQEVEELFVDAGLGAELSIAALNAPGRTVVSGPADAVDALEQRLAELGKPGRRLHTSHAFHSAMMEPILPAFVEFVRGLDLEPPTLPWISNLTGRPITDDQAVDPNYWADHLRRGVRFADGLETLFAEPGLVLLEVGPGNALSTLAKRHPAKTAEHDVLACLPHAKQAGEDHAFLLGVLGQLWLAGVDIDWKGFVSHEERRRVSLPTYPFQRSRYWIERLEGAEATASPTRRRKLEDWFYQPLWKPAAAPAPALAVDSGEPSTWLLFVDRDEALSEALGSRLAECGASIAWASPGDAFGRDGDRFTLRPDAREDYDALLSALAEEDRLPSKILHLWNVAWNVAPAAVESPDLETTEARGFWSLLALGQALGKAARGARIDLAVVARGLAQVRGDEPLEPFKATLLGPAKVLGQEYADLRVTTIDIASPEDPASADRLLAELEVDPDQALDTFVALRGGRRWVQGWERTPIDRTAPRALPLRDGGVYLITGGLGGFGLTFAEDLAKRHAAKLVLTGRSALPEPSTWDAWIAEHGEDDRTRRKIEQVRALEELGAEVLVLAADSADVGAMREVVRQARERFGGVDGVIHAAGVAGGGMIQLKTREMAERVLSAKVRGTLALEQALEAELADAPPEWLVLCSSTIAVLGGIGQVDYCAANNFLDAWAASRAERPRPWTVSINWSGWQEVGMAVETALPAGLAGATAAESTQPTEPAGEVTLPAHPLLDRCAATAERAVFSTLLDPSRHWVLSEHRISGTPTLPGTTHLELARAAFAHLHDGAPAELRDVFFLAPLMVPDGQTREAEIVLEPTADGHRFKVRSRAPGAPAWQDHAMGRVRALDGGPSAGDAPSAIVARCTERHLRIEEGELIGQAELVTWGPRWQSLREAWLGEGEGVARLELPASFLGDVDEYALHPALLDVATAITNTLAEGEALPLSYKGVKVHGALPRELYSHLRLDGEGVGRETVTADIRLLDADGRVLVEIEHFTMKRIGEGTAPRRPAAATATVPATTTPVAAPAQSLFNRAGIKPDEGVEALWRVLSRLRVPQVAVTPLDLGARLAQSRALGRGGAIEGAATAKRGGSSGTAHPRPDLPTPFMAPRTPTEEGLAEIWQGILGIDAIGVHDNFFDLGGDSVMGIQVVSQAGEKGLALAPEQLFEHQTVAELAEMLDGAEATELAAADDPPEEEGLESADLDPEELDKILSQLKGLE